MEPVIEKFEETDYSNSFDENIIGIINKFENEMLTIDIYKEKYKEIKSKRPRIYKEIKEELKKKINYNFIDGWEAHFSAPNSDKWRPYKKSWSAKGVDLLEEIASQLLYIWYLFNSFVDKNEDLEIMAFMSILSTDNKIIYDEKTIVKLNDTDYEFSNEKFFHYSKMKRKFFRKEAPKWEIPNTKCIGDKPKYFSRMSMLIIDYPLLDSLDITYKEYEKLMEHFEEY